MTNNTKVIAGFTGTFLSLILLVMATGYSKRTETAPLVDLTITQAACEYISQSGIATAVSNGICTIKVRFRGSFLGNGGHIEMAGLKPLMISGGQIVGVVRLNEDSDEPWSSEHQLAVIYVAASYFLLALSIWFLSLGAKLNEMK
jgi:hypothetical protein